MPRRHHASETIAPETTYGLVVTTGVRDIVGNALPRGQQIVSTTKAGVR